MDTYEITAECTNCLQNAIFTISKGCLFEDASLECPTCGCSNTLCKKGKDSPVNYKYGIKLL